MTDFDVAVGTTPLPPAAGPARFAPGSMIAARYFYAARGGQPLLSADVGPAFQGGRAG